jgi:IS30 family transposase
MRREKKPFYASTDAIYKWLYSVYGQRYCRYLCMRRYRKKPQKGKQPKREMIPNKISIRERPRGVKLHPWEWDAMVSPKKAETTASIAVACAIKEKYISGTKLENLKPESTKLAVRKMSGKFQMDNVTLDSGIENRFHKEFGIPAYFCDPHSPWQKPHVENSIGLLRRWFLPKKTDLSKVAEEELQTYFDILNHKYRKSLNYRSAYEVAIEHGILKTKVAFHYRI